MPLTVAARVAALDRVVAFLQVPFTAAPRARAIVAVVKVMRPWRCAGHGHHILQIRHKVTAAVM